MQLTRSPMDIGRQLPDLEVDDRTLDPGTADVDPEAERAHREILLTGNWLIR